MNEKNNKSFKEHLKSVWQFTKEKLIKIYQILKPSLIAFGIGLFFGFVIMLIFNPSGAFSGLTRMLTGGLLQFGTKGLGDILLRATPIILTGLALVVAFKTGLFNIGTPGQMVVGAFVAIYIGVRWTLPSPFHWMIAIFFGMIAGAIWGSIPGLLKAFTNTNEVVSSIMLNYVGMYLVVLLIKTPSIGIFNFNQSRTMNIKPSAEITMFGNLFGNSKVNFGFLIAILAGILIYILFKKKIGRAHV